MQTLWNPMLFFHPAKIYSLSGVDMDHFEKP